MTSSESLPALPGRLRKLGLRRTAHPCAHPAGNRARAIAAPESSHGFAGASGRSCRWRRLASPAYVLLVLSLVFTAPAFALAQNVDAIRAEPSIEPAARPSVSGAHPAQPRPENQERAKDGGPWTIAVVSALAFATAYAFWLARRARHALAASSCALRNAHELIEKTFATVADGVVILDRAGRVSTCNAAAVRLTGVDETRWRQSSVAAPAFALLRHDGSEVPLDEHAGAVSLRTGQALHDVVQGLRRPDERIVWLAFRTELLRDAHGNVTGVLVGFTDITAQRAAEEAGRHWRAHLDSILASLSEGVVLHERSGRVSHSNAAAERIIGRNILPVDRRAAYPAGWRFTRDDGTLVPAYDLPSSVTLRTGQPCRGMVIGITRPDGTHTWVSVNSAPVFGPDREVVSAVSTLTDITQRRDAELALRESEERFRQAFESAAVGMAMITPRDGNFLRVNQRFADFLGYHPHELVGRHISLISPPADHEYTARHIRRLLAGDITSFAIEKRYRHRSGGLRWGRLTMALVRDASGQPLHTIEQVEDITERKALESELREARDQALEASRLKSEFLANMSHEIRTPMNAIIGIAEILAATPLEPRQQEMSRLILGSAESLLGIINDILDHTKIEAGKLRIGLSTMNPATLVQDVAALMIPLARQKGLRLDVEIAPALDVSVRGDSLRIRQVITNLLGNALKFTHEGGITVSATATADPASEEVLELRIEVTDTGVGIPAAVQPKLFQPFIQAEGDAGRQLRGAGLGLSISRHLVELMNGRIGFVSTEGRGSTFWFSLPLSRAPAPPAASDATGEPPAPVAAPPAPRDLPRVLRLLVVEDNPASGFVAKLQLEHLGHRVELSGDGQQALQRLATERFDAVFLDCDLPGIDGFEVTRRVRGGLVAGIDPRLRIIALTAHAMPENRTRCLAAGMDDFITKPFTSESLRRVLRAEPTPVFVTAAIVSASGADAPVAPTSFDPTHLDRLRKLTAPDGRSVAEAYVAMCLAEIPPQLDQLGQLATSRLGTDLGRTAHSLAGTAANLGAGPFRACLRAVEAAASASDWDTVGLRLEAVTHEWSLLRAALISAFPAPTRV